MQIVWDKTVIEQMKSKYTLLELETFDVKGEPVTTYCVLPPEKAVAELAHMDSLKALHQDFLNALKDHDLESCEKFAVALTGRFLPRNYRPA
jgi:hypothetical protein